MSSSKRRVALLLGVPSAIAAFTATTTNPDTGEVLHIRLRKGSANTARGALRFVEELIARVERAGVSGEKLLRADSGFWSTRSFGAWSGPAGATRSGCACSPTCPPRSSRSRRPPGRP